MRHVSVMTGAGAREEEEKGERGERLGERVSERPAPLLHPTLRKTSCFDQSDACPLSSEYGTYKTVKVRFWPGLSRKNS